MSSTKTATPERRIASTLPTRSQFAYFGKMGQPVDAAMRATLTAIKGSDDSLLLRFRDSDGEQSETIKRSVKLWASEDVRNVPNVHKCKKHGPKIQRPAGYFDCEICFREYDKQARARRAQAVAEGKAKLSAAAQRKADKQAAKDAQAAELVAAVVADSDTSAQIDAAAQAASVAREARNAARRERRAAAKAAAK